MPLRSGQQFRAYDLRVLSKPIPISPPSQKKPQTPEPTILTSPTARPASQPSPLDHPRPFPALPVPETVVLTPQAAPPTRCPALLQGNSRQRARAKRALERQQRPSAGRPHARAIQALRRAIPHAIVTPFSQQAAVSSAATNGYTGRPTKSLTPLPSSLERLLAQGYRLIEAHGSHDVPLVSQEGRVIGVVVPPLAGQFMQSVGAAQHEMAELLSNPQISHPFSPHARGRHALVNFGIIHGNGCTHPCNLRTHPRSFVVDKVRTSDNFQRLAHYASAALQLWFPKLNQVFHRTAHLLTNHDPSLIQNFPRSYFPASCINLGPSVVTTPHRDSQNYAFGVCAIQALGSFDHRIGGHLVLEELSLVIEFPPGFLVLFPSAMISHYNLPIQPHEARSSFVQYCPGELLRYVDNGLLTDKKLAKENPEKFLEMQRSRVNWAERYLGFSKLDELEGEYDQ